MNNILEYLENSAALFPNKTALSIKNESVSFCELVTRSKTLASSIAEINCGCGIPVFVNRGINAVILFMAAVYCGSFYIPLDPDMPVGYLHSGNRRYCGWKSDTEG